MNVFCFMMQSTIVNHAASSSSSSLQSSPLSSTATATNSPLSPSHTACTDRTDTSKKRRVHTETLTDAQDTGTSHTLRCHELELYKANRLLIAAFGIIDTLQQQVTRLESQMQEQRQQRQEMTQQLQRIQEQQQQQQEQLQQQIATAQRQQRDSSFHSLAISGFTQLLFRDGVHASMQQRHEQYVCVDSSVRDAVAQHLVRLPAREWNVVSAALDTMLLKWYLVTELTSQRLEWIVFVACRINEERPREYLLHRCVDAYPLDSLSAADPAVVTIITRLHHFGVLCEDARHVLTQSDDDVDHASLDSRLANVFDRAQHGYQQRFTAAGVETYDADDADVDKTVFHAASVQLLHDAGDPLLRAIHTIVLRLLFEWLTSNRLDHAVVVTCCSEYMQRLRDIDPRTAHFVNICLSSETASERLCNLLLKCDPQRARVKRAIEQVTNELVTTVEGQQRHIERLQQLHPQSLLSLRQLDTHTVAINRVQRHLLIPIRDRELRFIIPNLAGSHPDKCDASDSSAFRATSESINALKKAAEAWTTLRLLLYPSLPDMRAFAPEHTCSTSLPQSTTDAMPD